MHHNTDVQRQGLLHDPTASIDQLTSSIKLDIITLKKQIEELATVQMSSRHGSRDSRQESLHTGHVVTQLQSVLLDTTRSFGNVLKDRSERLQERQDRRGHFGSAATSALGRPLNIDSPLRFRGSGGEGGGGGAASGGGDAMRPQGILQLTQLREPSVAYASSRANAVSEIESNIHELGGIFEQLNLMVMEQGEVVQRIDDNLETTLDNVSAGENELLKYFRSMGGGKWLVFKVAMVLLIFLVFFITFFV